MMGRTAEQTARMAELFEKKNLTPEESKEYQALINIPNDDKKSAFDEDPVEAVPVKPKTKAAPWYLWIPGIFVYSTITTLWIKQPSALVAIVLGYLLIYALPNMIWKSRQHKSSESQDKDVPGNSPPV